MDAVEEAATKAADMDLEVAEDTEATEDMAATWTLHVDPEAEDAVKDDVEIRRESVVTIVVYADTLLKIVPTTRTRSSMRSASDAVQWGTGREIARWPLTRAASVAVDTAGNHSRKTSVTVVVKLVIGRDRVSSREMIKGFISLFDTVLYY